jgi:hypothetical protein
LPRQLGGALLLLFGLWMAWAAIPSEHDHHHVQLRSVVGRSDPAAQIGVDTDVLSGWVVSLLTSD